MTYEQVIKDLHACIDEYDNRDCGECSQENWRVCRDTLMKQCLDLINGQKIEIERLRSRDEEFLLKNYSFDKYYNEHIKKAQSEAIKDFAERLKATITINNTIDGYLDYAIDYSCLVEDIDDLVKEMAEEYESCSECVKHWLNAEAEE